jgi:hypothetical protein
VKEADDPSVSIEKCKKAGFPTLSGVGCNRSLPIPCCGWENGEFELTHPNNGEFDLQWKFRSEQLVI